MKLTMMTTEPTHSSLFYIYSGWFVVLFVEAEDTTEGGHHNSTVEQWSATENGMLAHIWRLFLTKENSQLSWKRLHD